MKTEPTIIHCSALSMYPDCARRQAANMFGDEIAEAGYKLRQTTPNIGAATGTATHAAAAFSLRTKMEDGTLGNETEAEQRGLVSLAEETASGVLWDQSTQDHNTAQQQVVRQTRAYRNFVAPDLVPTAVEERLEADVGDDFILTGRVDLVIEPKGESVVDLKTGTRQRANGAQYGGYGLTRRAHGHRVERLIEPFIQRTTMKKPQPPPEKVLYPVATCEQLAWATIKQIKRDLMAFRGTADPHSFLANPNSLLCSDKYCPAWGTSFCRAHKGAVP